MGIGECVGAIEFIFVMLPNTAHILSGSCENSDSSYDEQGKQKGILDEVLPFLLCPKRRH